MFGQFSSDDECATAEAGDRLEQLDDEVLVDTLRFSVSPGERSNLSLSLNGQRVFPDEKQKIAVSFGFSRCLIVCANINLSLAGVEIDGVP